MAMSEYNTSDSKRIHHHNEWNLTLMVMVQMQTTIHTAAETTTVVAIRMVAAEVGTVTLANPETTTDRHSLRQLRRLRHRALQPHQQTMQLSTLSTTVQVRIHMPPMVDTKTILPTINTMLNSRHSRKAKQRLHHLEVKALLRRLRVPQVLRRRHLVDRAMAPCRLRQDCERSFAFGVSLDQGWKIWSSIVSHHLPSALRRVGDSKTCSKHRTSYVSDTITSEIDTCLLRVAGHVHRYLCWTILQSWLAKFNSLSNALHIFGTLLFSKYSLLFFM